MPEGDAKGTLVQANALFVDGSMAVLPAFSANLKSHFKSSAHKVKSGHFLTIFALKVDFIHAKEEARKMINAWVEANTAKKIKDLFPPNSLHRVHILQRKHKHFLNAINVINQLICHPSVLSLSIVVVDVGS